MRAHNSRNATRVNWNWSEKFIGRTKKEKEESCPIYNNSELSRKKKLEAALFAFFLIVSSAQHAIMI
jgi:hypothetical protein